MGWGETKLFLSKVVAWPDDGFGYVNLHYSMTAQDGRKIVTGKPYNSIDNFIGFAQWAENHATFKDIWFCLSSQTMAGQSTTGKPKAVRLSTNARFLKALWIDIDVGNKPGEHKHYDTVEEAWTALEDFIGVAKLPPLSACVKSGGGLHAYWISDTRLTPDEWRPYAEGLRTLLVQHGLKCDAGLTTDNVRLLRLPETSNHKYDPPRKVELMQLPMVEIDFANTLVFLTTLAPLSVQAKSAGALPNQFFDPAIFTKRPYNHSSRDCLSDGINKYDGAATLLDPTEVVKGCGFFRTALKTGGKDYDNPLWNLTTLCSTFLENGEALAHKMARGHVGYTQASTQALYERKVNDRVARDLGWPSCATIEANGCKDCAACALRASNKSPLNLAKPKPVTGTVIGTTTFAPASLNMSASPAVWLPDEYVLDHRKRVCYLEPQRPDKNGTPGAPIPRLLFHNTIDRPWAQKDPDVLHMLVSFDKGNHLMTNVRVEDIVGQGTMTALVRARLKPIKKYQSYIEAFLMSLLAKLHEEKEAQISYPFGWHILNGQRTGFVYGGVLTEKDGSMIPAGVNDAKMAKYYMPDGDLAHWKAACDLITGLGRPELDTLIALSFASPLIQMSGQTGMILSAFGKSGTGKTSAMLVGLAVWGDPSKTRENKSTTHNSMMNKLAQLRHLPTYWDEITDERAQSHCLDVALEISGGKEKGRLESLNGSVSQRAAGTWQCALAMSANISLVDFAMQKQQGHAGGINRILEYEVGPNDPSKLINTTDADRVYGALNTNYGMMGMIYSKLIAMNEAALDAEVRDTCVRVGRDLKATQEDRFWVSLIGCLLVGAKYGNMCGATLGLEAMQVFLYDVFNANRDKRDGEHCVGGSVENTENILSDYLKHRLSTGTIWTSNMHIGKGRAPAANVLQGPEIGRVATAIQVRFDLAHSQMIISRLDLVDWIITHKKGGVGTVLKAIQKHYGAVIERRSLAAGTRYAVTQESVLVITIGLKSPFREMLEMNGTGGAPAAQADAVVDTGIQTAEDIKSNEETARQVLAAAGVTGAKAA